MSEAKHTPGPWKWHWRHEDEDAPGSVFSEPFEGHAYAVAMMPRYQTKEQWEADARLIAAAPDLLEACQKLLGIVAIQNGNLHDDINAIQDEAIAAIKKAKGGE